VHASTVTGLVLVAGFLIFATGAVFWRLAFEGPPDQALAAVHAERRRHTWIHAWMLVAMIVTPAGLASYAVLAGSPLAAMAAVAYSVGAVAWIVALTFRLTVLRWAAAQPAIPDVFAPLSAWATGLYTVHMASAYTAFAVLGAAVLAADGPSWLGWLGVGLGLGCLAGFVGTRFAGPFNPPILAHTYTAVLGVWLLTQAGGL
jgi:hypothetical protein